MLEEEKKRRMPKASRHIALVDAMQVIM